MQYILLALLYFLGGLSIIHYSLLCAEGGRSRERVTITLFAQKIL
jgi:hypothetical protein